MPLPVTLWYAIALREVGAWVLSVFWVLSLCVHEKAKSVLAALQESVMQ